MIACPKCGNRIAFMLRGINARMVECQCMVCHEQFTISTGEPVACIADLDDRTLSFPFWQHQPSSRQ